ncbi:hypothetical protein U472_00205 [Orenia metallireducens]|jgi:hypothetical protein|uniref:Uncharacterized protein n=1 Tax=Orenia metallireducens TaxID=1413210 RepID=A0A1C0AD81_9FIRM|nr:hypothetical protein [Orenia metallireducens]OCL28614.1 hypothetical protein U472_00205 [Orenia metallireducens]
MDRVQAFSPVKQDFIWVGEYLNGTLFSEYDFKTKEHNDFYQIDRKKLIRFGLVGHGRKVYYEVPDGTFKIFGQRIDIIYRTKERDYLLTGNPRQNYNDIITYKDAETVMNIRKLAPGVKPQNQLKRDPSRINQYNLGYKAKLTFNNVDFHFKSIFKMPFNKKPYIYIWLVSNKDLEGELVFIRNGKETDRIKAPLEVDVGGELNWQLK